MMAVYEEFLAEISADTTAWHALPREVSAWWKTRKSTYDV
jgi:hypothetical protein